MIPQELPACLVEAAPNQRRMVLEEMIGLQAKADQVFGPRSSESGLWLVTRDGLQQCTTAAVATWKAKCIAGSVDALGQRRSTVLDLCGGLGSDAIHMARKGLRVWSIDCDRRTSQYAATNATAAGVGDRLTVMLGDVIGDDWLPTTVDPANTVVHIDPDRRRGHRRVTAVHAMSPPWSVVNNWLHRSRGGWVKLAPATNLDDVTLASVGRHHRLWVSSRTRVREQALVTGRLLAGLEARHGPFNGERSAVVLRGDDAFWFSSTEVTSAESKPLDGDIADAELGDWIIDPDAAIRAAGLTLAFASQFKLRCLGGPSGFLTGHGPPTAALQNLARVGRVVDRIPCREKKWKAYCRKTGVFPQTIKIRGLDLDPARINKSCRKLGERPVDFWLGRENGGTFCVITAPGSLIGESNP